MSEWRKIVGTLMFRLDTRWTWIFSFRVRPLFSLNRELIEHQNLSGRLLIDNFSPFLIIEPRFLGCSTRVLISTSLEAFRFVMMQRTCCQSDKSQTWKWIYAIDCNTMLYVLNVNRCYAKVESEARRFTPQFGCPSLPRVAIATFNLFASFHLAHISFHTNKCYCGRLK